MNSVSIPKCFSKFNPQNQQQLVSLVSQMNELTVGVYATQDSYVVSNLNETQIDLFVDFVQAFEQFDSRFIEYLIQTFGVRTQWHQQGYDLIFGRYTLFRYNISINEQWYGIIMEELHVKNAHLIVEQLGFFQQPKTSDYDHILNCINRYIDNVVYSKGLDISQLPYQIIPVKSCLGYN